MAENRSHCSDSVPSSSSKIQLPVIEELNLYVNSKIAKIIATGVVICFISYHGFLHAVDGGDSCHRLLSDGRFQGSLVWQPYGCMLHTYSNTDSRRCMRYVAFLKQQNHIVFLGDSRIRQLFYAMVKQVAVSHPKFPEVAHEELHYNDTNLHLNIEFFWRPVMDLQVDKLLNQWKRSKVLPKLIVIGSATHTIKISNGSSLALEEYKKNLTHIASALHQIGNKTRVLWMLQDPVVPERLKPERAAITNDQLDLYNMAAMEVLYGTNVQLWSSSRLVAQGSVAGFTDGLHAGDVAVKYDTQILLNLYCNDHLNFNDGTCCNSREAVTMTQIATFAALCSCPIIMIAVSVRQWFCASHHVEGIITSDTNGEAGQPLNGESSGTSKKSKQPSPQDFLMALGKLGLMMGYFFLCDRTSLFMKENKYFSQLNFWLPLGYVFALGLFFTEDTSQTRLLHRDMTDEWKGWMQLVILIYHMTGASQTLPIYMHIRVLVSAYLFLTGYGHFSYYWNGRDMGIVRYCQVMFRINFLVVVLCLVMNRPYQFYYFVPLISFWYTVMHVTLVLPPRITRPAHANSEASPFNYLYSIIKFIGLGGFITVLFLSEVFFEKIFVMKPWKALFVTTDDDIHEWWFRWQLDRYSLLYGMVFCLLYHGLTQYGIIDDKSGSNLMGGRLALLVSCVATIFIVSYTTMALLCTNKPDCNEIHPYVVWVPILGYIVLRNLVGILRTRYSSFFAWFGRISLELFVCQYHIWLAADTHGVLVLIPSYPVANVLVTSFIFICVCHEIHHITNVITPFLVPNDSRRAVRNLIVFAIPLLAIGVHDGIF
ncbi:N-acetylneuraminate 9-O-acetyltransferase-like isoform X1 [Macrobrachium nipponense]|uniref:N-acetylneuraminate 9-O-acetyltransferase-like isoform X1 n=1 Tax=Macrobrachium nipponense TaxID=159736 RepID=UPI0030C83863